MCRRPRTGARSSGRGCARPCGRSSRRPRGSGGLSCGEHHAQRCQEKDSAKRAAQRRHLTRKREPTKHQEMSWQRSSLNCSSNRQPVHSMLRQPIAKIPAQIDRVVKFSAQTSSQGPQICVSPNFFKPFRQNHITFSLSTQWQFQIVCSLRITCVRASSSWTH